MTEEAKKLLRESPKLVSEILNEYDRSPLFCEKFIEKFSGREWEIVSYFGDINKIRSVKRLSDGEIFEVGDKCNIGSISKILIDSEWSGGIVFICSNENKLSIRGVAKSKPLFTTEDGVEVFEGDKMFLLSTSQWILHKEPIDVYNKPFIGEGQFKYFSTREKAEEYILLNKPCLSVNDIKKAAAIQPAYVFGGQPESWVITGNRVIELAKQKING